MHKLLMRDVKYGCGAASNEYGGETERDPSHVRHQGGGADCDAGSQVNGLGGQMARRTRVNDGATPDGHVEHNDFPTRAVIVRTPNIRREASAVGRAWS
jgi:hypothetical protein